MVDGPISARAPKLVVAEVSLGHAVTRHLRMAARLAPGPRPSRATINHVQGLRSCECPKHWERRRRHTRSVAKKYLDVSLFFRLNLELTLKLLSVAAFNRRCPIAPRSRTDLLPNGMCPALPKCGGCSVMPSRSTWTCLSGTCHVLPTWGGCSMVRRRLTRICLSGTCHVLPTWGGCSMV